MWKEAIDVATSDSLTKVLAAAVVAALGFLGKQLTQLWLELRKERRTQKQELVQLQALLGVTGATFKIQNEHARTLFSSLKERNATLDISGGYERVFTAAFDAMTPEEKELHSLIRSITINSMRTGNLALKAWLDRDVFFQSHYGEGSLLGRLAQKLAELQTHLVLWLAKYEMWIPDHPEHALVYMADEERHGKGFPAGLDETVTRALGLI